MYAENCLMKYRALIHAIERLTLHRRNGYIGQGLEACSRCEGSLERQRAMLVHCELEAVKNQLNHLLCEVSNLRSAAIAEGTCCATAKH